MSARISLKKSFARNKSGTPFVSIPPPVENNDTAQTIELQILKAKYHEELLAAETVKHELSETRDRMRNLHGNYD